VVHEDEAKVARRLARLRVELADEEVYLVDLGVRRDLDYGAGGGDDGRLSEADPGLLEEMLLEETLHARQTPVHEGRRSSYGCIVLPGTEVHPDVAEALRLIELTDECDHVGARELANGLTTFVVRTTEGPAGLAVLDRGDELSLVRLTQEQSCYVVQRHPAGTVRVFGGDRLLLFENDEWTFKPYANTRWLELSHVTGAEQHFMVGGALLDLCLHLLSARHIGATFVWTLRGGTAGLNPRLARPARAAGVQLEVTDPDHAEAIATLLASIDGACLVEPDGKVAGVEAFLGATQDAVDHVRPHGGTRHTSAARFSFDVPEVVVFVVSADGPVTVFSDGVDVLHLDREGTFGQALARAVPGMARDISIELSRIKCPRCSKPLIVEQTIIKGWLETKSAQCPVCGQQDVASGNCFDIRTRVAKPWEKNTATVLWGWPVAGVAPRVGRSYADDELHDDGHVAG